jgi:hypothetical protein
VGSHQSQESNHAARSDRRGRRNRGREQDDPPGPPYVDPDAAGNLVAPEDRIECACMPEPKAQTDHGAHGDDPDPAPRSPRQTPHEPEENPLGSARKAEQENGHDGRADGRHSHSYE